MGKISLVDELLGLESQAGPHSVADFAASIAASNGMLIPLELLIQARLSTSVDLDHAQLLEREYRRKSQLLDTDRRVLACVCDIVTDDDGSSADSITALAACIAALAPAAVPRVLACALGAGDDIIAGALEQVAPVELVIRVTLDTAPRQAAAGLRALRSQLYTLPSTRLLAALYDSTPSATSTSAPCALLRELAGAVDLLCLLPLLGTADASSRRGAHKGFHKVAAELGELGLVRIAPGLYAQPATRVPQRPLPWLNRIMANLPQAEVLGLGPAARSRFSEVRFDNYVDPRHHARDLARGGYGIGRAYSCSPVDQFIEALLTRLASGAVVDVPALALRCQCASPRFLESCDGTIDGLRARGALGGQDGRRVVLDAANDACLPDIRAQLDTLRVAVPSITPLARR